MDAEPEALRRHDFVPALQWLWVYTGARDLGLGADGLELMLQGVWV